MKKEKLLQLLFAFCSFFVPFIIYYLTTNPYLSFTDNGELMGVCATLGIAHPTGYPLFTILGHLWYLLPLCSSKIFQMNLLASVWTGFASLAFFFVNISLFKILNRGSKTKHSEPNSIIPWDYYFLALISSLTFAFGKTIWGEATSLEVYSLQLLLFNLIFFAVFETIRSSYNPRWIFFVFFLLGLGFSNHLTTILIFPSILILLFFHFDKKISFSKPNLKSLFLLLLPFLAGLSFYLYLPIRSNQFPTFNWGWVSRSFDKFWYHVSGKQYRVWMFSSSETITENFDKFFSTLPFEFAYIGLLVVVLGFIVLMFKSRYILYILLLAFVSCLFYSLNYQIHDIETYFSLAFISLYILFSVGIYFLWEKFRYYSFSGIIVPILLIVLNYKENDESRNNLVITYTKNIVDNLEPNAVVLSSQWDYFCSAFWYLQQVEGYRKDVVLIEKELLRRTWYLEQLRRWYPKVINKSKEEMEKFLEQLELFESEKPFDAQEIQFRFENLLRSFVSKNIEERPIYITYDILQNELDRRPFLDYEQVPQGFALRLLKEFEEISTDLRKINTQPFENFVGNKHHLVQGIIQATSTNLVYLESYYRMSGKTKESEELLKVINKLNQF
ncbi:MAG: DUF2723 domain-containing protein [Ignavibacteria bacterium]|nr:DUF2723 domain-containing protein [Ignavibacteria bacterium]